MPPIKSKSTHDNSIKNTNDTNIKLNIKELCSDTKRISKTCNAYK